MPGGRPPKPTAIKRLAGNPGKRPLHDDPAPRVVHLSAPRHLSVEAKIEWRRVARELQALGLLTVVDRAALAAYCQAWGDWITARLKLAEQGHVLETDKGYCYPNPYVGIANRALDDMRRFGAEFGMTPASRTRVNGQRQEAELSLADILFAEVDQ